MSIERVEDYDLAVPSTSSGVVAEDNLPADAYELMRQATACYEQTIESINVIESTDVHVGPRFISVSQNIQNTEVAKGRILGVELVSPQTKKPLRCSIAVFVCWSLVVTGVLVFFILYFALNKKPTRLDLDIHEPWYLRRNDWYANADRGMELLRLPVSMVLIGHSVLGFCSEKYECIENVLSIQKDHQMERRWVDIGPNFLVGGNGFVFEGRGANIVSKFVKGYNHKIIGIWFLGNYVFDIPTIEQFDNLNVLFKELVRQGVLTTDYTLYGQCQVIGAIIPPGPHVMDNLHHFEHWNPVNRSLCFG